MKRRLAAIVAACIAAVSSSDAQSPALDNTLRGDGVAAIRSLFAKYRSGAPPAQSARDTGSSALTFTPTGDSGVARTLGDALGTSAGEKANLGDAFRQIVAGYNAEMAKEGRPNDLAAAVTFFIASNVAASRGTEVISDETSNELYRSLSTIMDTSALRSLSNADKHQLHDWFVSMGGFVLTTYTESKQANDKEGLATAAALAEHVMRLALGVDIKSFLIPAPAKTTLGLQRAVAVSSSNSNGISVPTTTFSDGWTAQLETDFVRLTKGDLTVYLHWPIEFTDELRKVDTADYMWNAVVVPRFTIRNAQKFEDPIPDALERLYYIEGNGTEKATGRAGFVAMKAVSISGFSHVIVALAPTKASYQAAFPTPKDMTKMLNANRFAVTAGDIVGKWKGLDGSSLSYYNSNSGAYAGTSTVAVSDEFKFNADGTYQSSHAQGSTQFGVTKTGQQHYNGTARASNWEVTLTKRFEGKTETFNAYFEAVKNGRVLHLTNKDAPGVQFHLVLTK